MVGRALSERVKKQLQRRAENAKYQGAIDEYHREQEKPPGEKRRGFRPIAQDHGVNYKTLGNLVNQ